MSVRRKRIVLIGLGFALIALLLIGAALVLVPGSRTVQAENGAARIFFAADRQTVLSAGDCVQVEWRVEGITAVYINEEPVVGEGSRRVCLVDGKQPELRVVFQDGTEQTYTLPIALWIEHPVALFLGIAALAIVFSALLTLALPSSTPSPEQAAVKPVTGGASRVLQAAGAVALGLLFVAIGLELLLRLFFGLFGTQAQKISYLYSREEVAQLDPYIMALPLIEYGLSPDRAGHNHLGYRGGEIAVPKPEGVFRVVAMGGSTTYGFTADDETYPAWLERTLREQYGYDQVEVLNAGVHGYTTYNTFVNLALRIVELDPDLVIIYHAGNDVLPREVDPDCYREINPLLGLDPRGQITTNYNAGTFSPSALYRFITIRLGLERDPGAQTSETSWVTGLCRRSGDDTATKAQNVAANSPIYFERNLESIIALARFRHIPLLLSTWAYYEANTEAPQYWRDAVAEHNDIIRRLGAEYDVPVIDYAQLAPQTADLWSDYVHMNGEGSRHQGEALAAFIVDQGLIGQSG